MQLRRNVANSGVLSGQQKYSLLSKAVLPNQYIVIALLSYIFRRMGRGELREQQVHQ